MNLKLSVVAIPVLAAALVTTAVVPARARLCDCDLLCELGEMTRAMKEKFERGAAPSATESKERVDRCLRTRCGRADGRARQFELEWDMSRRAQACK